MKKIHLIPVLLLGLSLSCKDSSQNALPSNPSTPTVGVSDYDAQLQEEVKNHPSINAPIVEQSKVKNIDVFLMKRMATSIKYDYYTDGKIKDIIFGNTTPYEYAYKDGVLTTNYTDKSYLLDNNGLAQSIKDNAQIKFFYKDGFLLRTNIAGDFKYTYSTTGNLTKAAKGNESLDYEYTDYPNTIRQEILKLQEYSNSIRDFYLGRYSTNLIKEIKYNGSTVMSFEYEFDAQKRVTKVTMNRTTPTSMNILTTKIIFSPPAIIEYNLSY